MRVNTPIVLLWAVHRILALIVRKNGYYVDESRYRRTRLVYFAVLVFVLPVSLAIAWLWLRKPLADVLGKDAADFIVGIFPLLPSFVILYRASRSHILHDRWYRQGRCLGCGYPRDGVTDGVCPECGRAWVRHMESDPERGHDKH